MRQGISRAEILRIASKGHFYVSKYSWHDANIRKKCRKMLKEGLLVLKYVLDTDFVYVVK